MPDWQQLDAEAVLSGMLSAVFALAARGAVTSEVLDQWRASAARLGLSAIVTPWLAFVEALFINNTLNAETAVLDQSLAWTWQAVASIRVATDTATRPRNSSPFTAIGPTCCHRHPSDCVSSPTPSIW